MNSKKRLGELDSMRGLAAFSVVLAHISIIIPSFGLLEKLNKTPLHLFWLGHESVILFFILSGFVLSIPYINNKPLRYKNYLVRRICRIMIPSAISILVVLSLIRFLFPVEMDKVSTWGNSIWLSGISTKDILDHIFLLNETNTMKINPVLWSLIQEMRISIIFPPIAYLIIKIKLLRSLLLTLAIPVLFFASYYIWLKVFNYDITKFSGYSSFLLTPHYVAFFILGIIMAQHKNQISKMYSKLQTTHKLILMLLGLVTYMYVWIVFPNNSIFHMFIINDWMIAIGSCIFITFSLNSKIASKVLLYKPINFIGQISYSLYLYHLIVILTLLHSFKDMLPLWSILAISVPVSLFIATIMYYLVEIPSIKLGKVLTANQRDIKKLSRKKVTIS